MPGVLEKLIAPHFILRSVLVLGLPYSGTALRGVQPHLHSQLTLLLPSLCMLNSDLLFISQDPYITLSPYPFLIILPLN